MTVLSDYVSRMIEAGMDQDEAMQIAAELFAAGVASASARSVNAIRQQRYRDRLTVTKRNETVTKRNEPEASQTVTNRNESVTRYGSEKTPLSTKINTKKVDRQNRGSRITPDWTPSDAERSFAKQEGFSETEIDREVGKFRDHWAATAGSKGVKLDWAATWRKWIRNAADWAGKAPPAASGAVVAGFYAKGGSEQLDAWSAHTLETTGKPLPRDKNQGWHVKAEWPPGYVPVKNTHDPPPAPVFRSIQ